MDTQEESSRPTRVQVIGALSLIVVVVLVVLGIVWTQAANERLERERCEASGLVQDGTRTVEDCMLIGD